MQLLNLAALGFAAVARATRKTPPSHAGECCEHVHVQQARYQAPVLPGLRHSSVR